MEVPVCSDLPSGGGDGKDDVLCRVMLTWFSRFVLTSDDKLSYYKGEHRDAKALGMIDCHGIKKVTVVNVGLDAHLSDCSD